MRAAWEDIETVAPSNWGPGGGYRIPCGGECGLPYARQHRYILMTKTEALAAWRDEHPREKRGNK